MKVTIRAVVGITIGLITYFIVLAIIAGLFGIALESKGKSLREVSSLLSFSVSAIVCGYIARDKGSLMGFLLAAFVIAQIVLGWRYLLNLSSEKILDILGKRIEIIFEFIGYMIAGLLFGHVGCLLQKHFRKRKGG